MKRNGTSTWPRLRQTLVFTVIIFTFAMTMLVGVMMLMSLVYGDPVRIYFNKMGERTLELALMTIVIGTMPFVLLILDESFSRT